MADAQARFGVLAYGPRESLHVEAFGALLSLLAYRPEQAECVVLTDRPERYRWFDGTVTIERLSPAILAAWQGPAKDRYRPKIEALRHLASRGPAHVVLIDTDTLARRPLDSLIARLDAGAFLLHRREYPLASPPRKGDRSLKYEVLGRSWHGMTPKPDTAMWNGGVIGCSRSHLTTLNQLPDVFDALRAGSGHFAVEQLTYSIVFALAGTIEEAAPWVDHYWANRAYFRRAIEQELIAVFMERLTLGDAIDRVRARPITGPLDGRPSKWQATISRWLGQAGIVGREIPE